MVISDHWMLSTSWIIEVENVVDNRKVDNESKLMVISDHCELSNGSD